MFYIMGNNLIIIVFYLYIYIYLNVPKYDYTFVFILIYVSNSALCFEKYSGTLLLHMTDLV